MISRHRRAPSAMPAIGFEEAFDLPTSEIFPVMPIIKMQRPPCTESSNLKTSLKSTTTSQNSQGLKFSDNCSKGIYNDYCKYSNSSNESSVKSVNQCVEVCEILDNTSDIPDDQPFYDLSEAVETIFKQRMNDESKILALKKSIKKQLAQCFKKDREVDKMGESDDTAEGHGYSFNFDYFGLGKFDANAGQQERRRPKIVKFKDNGL
ncbi:hypothetical protein SteCoe_7625 [Stentor coeruleus]|uniref:Uncharacterized protein n=1 Tax=Stentor coeruleus TaxID=5963 RepID=A0A1R2CMG2_9CILI|nr:hypothetical protein SteCoe_7625 [Stentor coeruleus]